MSVGKEYKGKTDVIEKDADYGFGVRHLQAACMFLCMMTLYISRGCTSVAVLAMTDKKRMGDTNVNIFDWDKKTQGLILSSFYWGYVIMQVPGGMLSKRFGGKLIILMALIANGLLCLSIPTLAQVGGWKIMCVVRVLMGLTQACLYPSSHTLLGRWFPAHEYTLYMGLIYGGVHLGTIISMPVSGVLAGTRMGWKLIYYAVAGLIFSASVLWYFLSASTPEEHHMITRNERHYIEKKQNIGSHVTMRVPWIDIFKSKEIWAIMIAHCAVTSSFILFFVDLPTYLEKGLHISFNESASLSALPFLGMWVGTLLCSTASGFIDKRKYFTTLTNRRMFNSLGLVGSAAGLISLTFLGPNSQGLVMAILFITMFFEGAGTGGYMANILDLSINYAGVVLGIINTAGNIGSILTPVITSLILRNDPTDVSRWKIVFYTTAAVNVIACVACHTLTRTDRKDWDDPAFLDKKYADPEETKPAINKKTEEIKFSGDE